MNTQTITTWTLVPRFTTKKPLLVDKTKIRVRTFMKGPKYLYDKISMISHLRDSIGIKEAGKMTFKTGYLSTKNKTLYNGYLLFLRVNNDIVEVIIKKENNYMVLNAWDIETLTNILTTKNPDCKFLNNFQVSKLIKDGDMVVKFYVSKLKNHGTTWRILK